jgi:hypothetical protein
MEITMTMRSEEEVRKLLETFDEISKQMQEHPEKLIKMVGGNVGPVLHNINYLMSLESLNTQIAVSRWILGADDPKLLELYQLYLSKLKQV